MQSQQLHEAKKIAKSLFAIKVIRVLSEKKLLRDSLGGNSLTVRVHGVAACDRFRTRRRSTGCPSSCSTVPAHTSPEHAVKSRQSRRRLR